ncbi:MAG: LuxR family transcriptional regulator, partial [Mycobacteriaceae bacterium]|nr:LuxR family transcriptional regulator [Mycobacteriaceae bacterium]
ATLAVAAPLPLSSREREIALLVSEGLSNRQIADALTMSVRTVEGHIYRACNKLGTSTRTELGRLVAQFAPASLSRH